MSLLVTGGTGFVMSHLVRQYLEADPAATVTILDAAPPDALARRFFAQVSERLSYVQADVLQPEAWMPQLAPAGITHIVHAATITPSPEREAAEPARILDVNIRGTVIMLDFARTLPRLRRFIYISSGAAYGDALPETPPGPVLETSPCNPGDLYGISKFASERITRRYKDMYGMDAVSARLASVYGPMDRTTPARSWQCMPNRIAHLALAGETITVNSLEAGGDWIHAADVGRGLAQLLAADHLSHDVYNVSYGQFVTFGELLEIVREIVPGLRWQIVPAEQAVIYRDPHRRLAQWDAYDNERMRMDVGWRPRPIRQALRDYVDWIKGWESAATSVDYRLSH